MYPGSVSAIGMPLREDEIISYVFTGLGSKYEPLVMSLTTRSEELTLEDVYAHLLSFEHKIEQHNTEKQAMDEEFTALQKNRMWHLIPPRPGVNIIDSKWVFKLKRKADGSIDRYKAGQLLKVSNNAMVLIMMILLVSL